MATTNWATTPSLNNTTAQAGQLPDQTTTPAGAPFTQAGLISSNVVPGTQAAQFNANLQSVDKGETVAGNLDKMLAADSPYLQRARAQSSATSNARGLLNSSMAAGAGVAAGIDAATPIAQADANIYANARDKNQSALNDGGQFNVDQANRFSLADKAQQDKLKQMEIGQGYEQANMILGQEFDLTKMDVQSANTIRQMSEQEKIDLTKMARADGYDLNKMSVQQINDLRKMSIMQDYDLEKMDVGLKNTLEQMTAQETIDLNKMAKSYGYDLNKMDKQQALELIKMDTLQGYDLKKMDKQLANTLLQMDAQDSYDLNKMLVANGYDLGKMDKQQALELIKMETLKNYDLEKMDAGLKNTLEQMSAQDAYDLNKMAKAQGYNIETMDAQQALDLIKMSTANSYDLNKMALAQGYTIETLQAATKEDLIKMSAANGYDLEKMAKAQGYDIDKMDKQQLFDLAKLDKTFTQQEKEAQIKFGYDKNLIAMQQASAKEIALIDNKYKALIQASASATSLSNTVSGHIQDILTSDLDEDAKTAAIAQIQGNYENSLALVGALAGDVNLQNFFGEVLGLPTTPSATPSAPTLTPDQQTSINTFWAENQNNPQAVIQAMQTHGVDAAGLAQSTGQTIEQVAAYLQAAGAPPGFGGVNYGQSTPPAQTPANAQSGMINDPTVVGGPTTGTATPVTVNAPTPSQQPTVQNPAGNWPQSSSDYMANNSSGEIAKFYTKSGSNIRALASEMNRMGLSAEDVARAVGIDVTQLVNRLTSGGAPVRMYNNRP